MKTFSHGHYVRRAARAKPIIFRYNTSYLTSVFVDVTRQRRIRIVRQTMVRCRNPTIKSNNIVSRDVAGFFRNFTELYELIFFSSHFRSPPPRFYVLNFFSLPLSVYLAVSALGENSGGGSCCCSDRRRPPPPPQPPTTPPCKDRF